MKDKRKNRAIFIVFIIFLMLAGGCRAIDKKKAEYITAEFVKKSVKFFARNENVSVSLPSYRISGINSYRENNSWVVIMHVSSKLGNDTKENDVTAKLDDNGNIVEFNGKKFEKLP